MDLNPPNTYKPLPVSVEQSKLLGSAIRIKILNVISDIPRTAKQVADLLGQTPGNIHYHMQRLNEGELINLVETREAGGIIEKYYKAKSKWFNPGPSVEVDTFLDMPENSSSVSKINTRLLLSKDELHQLTAEFRQLLEKWEAVIPRNHADKLQEFAVGIKLLAVGDSEESEGEQG
jgi:DNA-binding transcriptional ArsR family regulator